MGEVIQVRGGERIVLDEFPPDFMDGLNERLDEIAAEDDTLLSAVDRLIERHFDRSLEGSVTFLSALVLGLTALVVAFQVATVLS
jgi:hypothetical protein